MARDVETAQAAALWTWSSVGAGVVAALIVHAMLTMLALGVGLLSIDIPTAANAPITVSTAALLWWIASGVCSLCRRCNRWRLRSGSQRSRQNDACNCCMGRRQSDCDRGRGHGNQRLGRPSWQHGWAEFHIGHSHRCRPAAANPTNNWSGRANPKGFRGDHVCGLCRPYCGSIGGGSWRLVVT